MAITTIDEGWLVKQLNEFFTNEHLAERVAAETRQREAAHELRDNRRSIDGLGRPRMEVDTYAFHMWGKKLGYECWKDKQFLREFERDNDHVRVKAIGTKQITAGYGTKSAGAAKRYSKSYG
jgi:hypothetical protein